MSTLLSNLTTNPASMQIVNGLCVLAISILVTGILIPLILLISYRKNLFDMPDERKIHRGTIPRLGGMAFMPAIILATSIVTGVMLIIGPSCPSAAPWALFNRSVEICFGICALMIMYLVGLADDLIGVKYRAKFVAQIIAGILIVASGLMVSDLQGFLGIYTLPVWGAILLSVIVVVLVINSINFIDGIDGLASGLCAVGLLFYAFVCYSEGLHLYFLLSLAALGTLIPFFYYNVFGSVKLQKKIFMGDTGALTSGLILCIIAFKISTIEHPTGAFAHCKSLVLAFAPLVVPCLDVLRVFIHRLRRHRSPFMPGRTHIHHKFLALGLRQGITMPIIIALSALIITLDFAISPVASIFAILMIDIAFWTVLNIILTRIIRRYEAKHPEARGLFD